MTKIISLFSHLIWYLFKTLMTFMLLLWGHKVLLHKQTEARMRAIARKEAQSRMNEFLSIISHELRTPLTSIKGNIQLMGRKLKNSPNPTQLQLDEAQYTLTEARQLIERTEQQVTRLTRIVNGLIESSRISTNTMDLLFEVCELNTLVHEVVHDSHLLPQIRVVNLTIPEEKSILIMGDTNRIKQVITHYLSNAHKYSPLSTSIAVELREDGQAARFEVRDEGQGIPPHEQKRIWERYYRVPGATILNGSEVGLGLGLHICQTIIQQHWGDVGVTSTPGAGSTFWFTLPLAENVLNTI